jgi:hypothetical protein
MACLLTALVLLTLIAASVTIVDAVRAPHWRVVAVERRQSWRERTGHADEPAADDDGHDDRRDRSAADGLGAPPLSSARG